MVSWAVTEYPAARPGILAEGSPSRLSSPGTDALLWTSEPGPDSQGTPALAPELTDHESAMPIRVLASVIQRDDRLLVCQRPRHKRHGGLWEFPGGKVKDGLSHLAEDFRESVGKTENP